MGSKIKRMERIICAAIWFNDGKDCYVHQPKNINTGIVIAGRRHHNCFYTMAALKGLNAHRMDFGDNTQGFLTNTNRFVDRKEAGEIAFKAGQTDKLRELLFSEDLY